MGKLTRHLAIRSSGSNPPLLNALHMATQINRRANLRACINQLNREGITSTQKQAESLGLYASSDLESFVAGSYINEEAAREIEWSMQKPKGWLDNDHRLEPLDN